MIVIINEKRRSHWTALCCVGLIQNWIVAIGLWSPAVPLKGVVQLSARAARATKRMKSMIQVIFIALVFRTFIASRMNSASGGKSLHKAPLF